MARDFSKQQPRPSNEVGISRTELALLGNLTMYLYHVQYALFKRGATSEI